jgi:molecular chaperone DnaJ
MAARPDYYKTLGVDKRATADEIKTAYRKLARQYHPDRNPGDASAEARFKEISQAHDILGDPDKRAQYDSGSGPFSTGAGPGGGFGGFGNFDFDGSSMGDILSNLFGGSTSGRRVRTRPRPEKGADLEAQVSITFDQAVSGAQVPLQVPMHATCPTCRGTGAKPGTTPIVCPRCEGRGIETQGQGMFSISQPCSLCGGAGTVIEDPCPTCQGAGAVRTVKKLRVNIPAGVKDGSRIRLAGRGEPGRNGGPAGDLYLITKVAPSPLFKRKGEHLEVEVPLSIPEALRGADVQVPTLDGTKTLRVAPGTPSGTVQRLRGEGPPKLGGAGRGDIHYRFVIDVPEHLSDEQQQAVEELSRTLGGDPRAGLFANGDTAAKDVADEDATKAGGR